MAECLRPLNLFQSAGLPAISFPEIPEMVEEPVPDGPSTRAHVVALVRSMRDYGWNEVIASAVDMGNYHAALAFCAQARTECLSLEKNASSLPCAIYHFKNYMKYWVLESRIQRLSYRTKMALQQV